jgi:thioredoxin 2
MTASHYTIICPACSTANRVPVDKEGKSGRCGNCRNELPPLYLHPVQLTAGGFDNFASSYHGPIVAEFWAPW